MDNKEKGLKRLEVKEIDESLFDKHQNNDEKNAFDRSHSWYFSRF